MTRWALAALVAQAIASVLTPWVMVRYVRMFTTLFTEPFADPEAMPSPEMFTTMIASVAAMQIVGIVQLAGLVILCFWIYRAAVAAVALGLHARHDPALAVAGWFIPVLNFWWPCQSLLDLLPPDHPTRRTIVWVWVVFVLGPFVMIAGVLAAMFTTGAAPLAVVAVGAMMTASGWLSGVRLVPVVLAEHERLAAA